MSYILEALQQAQQTRAVGQTPPGERWAVPVGRSATPQRWAVMATLLAATALLVAVYALLRPPPLVPPPALPVAVTPPAPPVILPPIPPPARETPMVVVVPPVSPLPTRGASELRQAALQQVENEIAAEARRQPVLPLPARRPPVAAVPAVAPPPSPVTDERPPIPADVRTEIEAFKRELQHTQRPRSVPVIPPRPAARPAKTSATAPSHPAVTLSVHVYHRDPRQRFVYLNQHRLREHETSPDGVTVAEVLPDGVLLTYRGQQFFHAR